MVAEETNRPPDAPPQRFSPYREYRDSGVEWLGEIPAHWQSLGLGLVTISRCDGPFGSGLKSEHYSESGIRVVRLQNIGWAEFADLDAVYLDAAYARQLGDHSVKGDDVLIAGLGDDGHPVGRACVAPVEIEPAMVKADCFRFRLDRQRILPRYAAFQLSATSAAVAGCYATGATRARMNLATSTSRKIALPPLREQEAIVAFLDRETAKIDALVTTKERLIELLQEKRTALITRAVTRGLDPNVPMRDCGVEWLGEIPVHWELMPLKRILRRCDYGISESLGGSGDIRVLTMAHVQDGEIVLPDDGSIDAVDQSLVLESGDLLFNRTNSREFVAKVGIFRGDRQDRVTFASYLVRLTARDSVEAEWLNYLLNSTGLLGMARSMALLSVNQANLNPTKYQRIVVPMPELSEQRRIAGFARHEATRIDTLVRKIREAIDQLREFRMALISAAVTGKIDVREAAPR